MKEPIYSIRVQNLEIGFVKPVYIEFNPNSKIYTIKVPEFNLIISDQNKKTVLDYFANYILKEYRTLNIIYKDSTNNTISANRQVYNQIVSYVKTIIPNKNELLKTKQELQKQYVEKLKEQSKSIDIERLKQQVVDNKNVKEEKADEQKAEEPVEKKTEKPKKTRGVSKRKTVAAKKRNTKNKKSSSKIKKTSKSSKTKSK